MVKQPKETRTQEPIGFTPTEKKRIKKVAKASGETFSGYIRRQILMIVAEEERQDIINNIYLNNEKEIKGMTAHELKKDLDKSKEIKEVLE